MTEITQILGRIQAGEADAADALLHEVYGELRKLAAARMAREGGTNTLQATALVHEAWLKIAGEQGPHFENRRHFFGAAGEAMRRILVDRARRRARLRHGGGQTQEDRDVDAISASTSDERIVSVNEAVAALESADPDKAEIVKLKFFVGLENAETAEALGVSVATVERHWAYSKAWMMRWIQRHDTPPS